MDFSSKGLIFTILLTAGGAVAGILHPFYGLLAYIALAILRPGTGMWKYTLEPWNYSRVVGVALLAGWVLHAFGKWDLRRSGVVIGLMVAYWFWLIPSTLMSLDPPRGWEVFVFYAKVFLPVLVGVTMIDSIEKVKQLAWVIVLCQGWVALELNLEYYRGYNRVWEEGFGAMDNNCVAIAMVTGVGFAFFLGLGHGMPWHARLAAFLCAALQAHVIMFSYSRGGMLALALTGLIAYVLIPKKFYHYAAFAAAIALAIRMAGPEVQERFWTIFASGEYQEASAGSRLVLWSNCLELGLRYPFFGIGPDHFGQYAPEFGWPLGKEAHSLWLQSFAEVGLPGMALLLAFFIVCIVQLWPLTRESTPVSDPWVRDAARMVIASLIGFMVAAQFVTIWALEQPFYVVLVGCSALILHGRSVAAEAPAQTEETTRTAVRVPQEPVQAASGF